MSVSTAASVDIAEEEEEGVVLVVRKKRNISIDDRVQTVDARGEHRGVRCMALFGNQCPFEYA